MHLTDFILLLLQLAAMLACGLAGGALMRKLHQPAVLGEMIGGIVLGPTVFGLIAPEVQAGLFPVAGSAAVLRNSAVKLGMLFFMFAIGLEINPRGVLHHGRSALCIGLIGTLVPLAAGFATVYFAPNLFPIANEAHRFPLALFVGAALANSANPVLARILLDLGLLKQRLGAIIMSATVVDDLMSWTLLFVVFEQMSLNSSASAAAAAGTVETGALAGELMGIAIFFAVTLAAGWIVSKWLAAWRGRHPENVSGRMGLIAVCILFSAAAAEWLEIHAFLGPFLFGIALTPTEEDALDESFESLRRFSLGFFVPIYFVSLGLTTDFAANFVPALVVVIVVVASVSKIPAAYFGGRYGGLDRRTAWAVGWGMNARGATGIILANLGLEKGAVDRPLYVALVVMAILTSILAAPSMKWILGDRLKDETTAR
ncbi:MAG: cation:proton antiporter [Planctomycetaceae bacterium]|nr:cation:proton antiporter [Planctomycetaceae bacterium]